MPTKENSRRTISDTVYSSTKRVSVLSEQPPEGLAVEFQYIRGGMMTKHDLWNTILRSISKAALLPWNGQILTSIEFAVTSNVAIRFISSVNPPRYQYKFVIWTLAEAFDFYNDQRHYSNCFFTTEIGKGPTALRLGVGSIKSTLMTMPGSQSNSSALGLMNDTPMLAFDDTPFNQSLDADTNISFSNSSMKSPSSVQTNTRGLSFALNYVVNGESISDRGLYEMILNLLVFAAQQEPKSNPSGLIRAYNSRENYTFAIGPTSDAARDNLPWKFMIPALGFLPGEMLTHGPGGRWAELSGRIKLDGAFIGKLRIVKGQARGPILGSCDMVEFDAGDEGSVPANAIHTA